MTSETITGKLAELAAERVAVGGNDSIEAAVWSITYSTGYVHGRSDARNSSGSCPADASEGYRAGYTRGYRWDITHPLPAICRGDNYPGEPAKDG